jgi:hypothetical protein
LSNTTKSSFVIGAIGGFLIALLRIPGNLGWTEAADAYQLHFQILILAWILISIGFFGLWRKSGNVIPLVSAICIIVFTITRPLLWFLWLHLLPGWLNPADFTTIAWIFSVVGWITAGISAWLLREEFSPFSIVAALVFLACGAVNLLTLFSDLWYWFFTATAIVAGIYFLDTARTKT